MITNLATPPNFIASMANNQHKDKKLMYVTLRYVTLRYVMLHNITFCFML